MSRIVRCQCGGFKWRVVWATAYCACCGARLLGKMNMDWYTKSVDVINLMPASKKEEIKQ